MQNRPIFPFIKIGRKHHNFYSQETLFKACWHLIFYSHNFWYQDIAFCTRYIRSSNQQVPLAATLIWVSIGRNSDLSLSYVKGCCPTNKQFNIDSFLDWKVRCKVFTHFLNTHPRALFRMHPLPHANLMVKTLNLYRWCFEIIYWQYFI